MMKNKKTKYVVPQAEVIVWQAADMITSSAGFDGEEHDLMPIGEGSTL